MVIISTEDCVVKQEQGLAQNSEQNTNRIKNEIQTFWNLEPRWQTDQSKEHFVK